MRLFLPLFLLFFYSNNLYSYADSPISSSPGAILQYNTNPWAIPKDTLKDSADPSNQPPKREADLPLAPVEYTPATPNAVGSESTVFIERIDVEGATQLSPKEIRAAVQPYENRKISFNEAQKLADQLTNMYILAGYINSQVYIPPQNLAKGILLLKALEVKVEEVHLEPSRWISPRGILPRIRPKPGELFNLHPLTRSIRLINENPDIFVKAQLKPGEKSGTSRISLETISRFPLHVTPFWDNLGRENIGFQRYGVTVTHNNLTGLGDINTLSWNTSKRAQAIINQYSLPVGPYGTQLGLDFAYSKVRLGGELKPLEIVSSSRVVSPAIRQALWKNDRFGVNTELAFDFKDLNTNLLGNRFQSDQVRIIRPSVSGYLNDRSGRINWNQEIGIGIPGFGGSTGDSGLASKPGSGTRFLRLNGTVTRIQKLPLGTTGVLRARYQYSPDRLLSVEQFQAGGAFTVRGYREGNSIGDSGYVFNAELYTPLLFFIKPTTKIRRLQNIRRLVNSRIQVVGFSDMAQLYTNRPKSGEFRRTKLMSYGVGLRLQLNRYLVLRTDVGFPIFRQSGIVNNPRFHFGLQSTLF
jgi:hemolysin activation/secretion protein